MNLLISSETQLYKIGGIDSVEKGLKKLLQDINLKQFAFTKRLYLLLLLLTSVLVQSCESKPTAKLSVNLNVNGCSTQYQTNLWTVSPVTDLPTLDRVSSETTEITGCGIDELEYSFNVSPIVAKIEFEIDGEEVTAFVPMQKGVTTPQPFIDGDISLESINVKVDFPNGNPPAVEGFYRVSK